MKRFLQNRALKRSNAWAIVMQSVVILSIVGQYMPFACAVQARLEQKALPECLAYEMHEFRSDEEQKALLKQLMQHIVAEVDAAKLNNVTTKKREANPLVSGFEISRFEKDDDIDLQGQSWGDLTAANGKVWAVLVFASRSDDGGFFINLYHVDGFHKWITGQRTLKVDGQDYYTDPTFVDARLKSSGIFYLEFSRKRAACLCTLHELVAKTERGEQLRDYFCSHADYSRSQKHEQERVQKETETVLQAIYVEDGWIKKRPQQAQQVVSVTAQHEHVIPARRERPVIPQGDEEFARKLQEDDRRAQERLAQDRRNREEQARPAPKRVVMHNRETQRQQAPRQVQVEKQRREEVQSEAWYAPYVGGGSDQATSQPPYVSYVIVGILHGLCNNYLSGGTANRHLYHAPWREWLTVILFWYFGPSYKAGCCKNGWKTSALLASCYGVSQAFGEMVPPITWAPNYAVTGPWRNFGINFELLYALFNAAGWRLL